MKTSLIIPALNEETYIGQCLRSVLAQTQPFTEVIMIDNGSSDRTVAIARQLGVKILQEPKKGVVFARNRGFNSARGDIVARIDADTILPNNWNERIATEFAKSRAAAVTGAPLFYDTPLPRLMSAAYKLLVFDYNRWLLRHHIVWGSNMAIRRSAWQQVRSFTSLRTDVHEDLDLAISLARHGHAINFQPNLRVAASLRRLHCQPTDFIHYVDMWYQTLAIHELKVHGLDRLIGRTVKIAQPWLSSAIWTYNATKHSMADSIHQFIDETN